MYFLQIYHLHVLERGVRVEEVGDERQIELVVARDDVLRGDETATSHLVCLLQHALGTVPAVWLLGGGNTYLHIIYMRQETRSFKGLSRRYKISCANVVTVVPVMNGHPRDQAKVSVHCRWLLITGTDGQAGDAKYNTPCNTTLILSPPAIFLMNTRIVIITSRQHGTLRNLSIASLGARQRFLVEMTTENVAFVCTVRYSRCWQPINDCPRPR